jgi:hypothetical protein
MSRAKRCLPVVAAFKNTTSQKMYQQGCSGCIANGKQLLPADPLSLMPAEPHAAPAFQPGCAGPLVAAGGVPPASRAQCVTRVPHRWSLEGRRVAGLASLEQGAAPWELEGRATRWQCSLVPAAGHTCLHACLIPRQACCDPPQRCTAYHRHVLMVVSWQLCHAVLACVADMCAPAVPRFQDVMHAMTCFLSAAWLCGFGSLGPSSLMCAGVWAAMVDAQTQRRPTTQPEMCPVRSSTAGGCKMRQAPCRMNATCTPPQTTS